MFDFTYGGRACSTESVKEQKAIQSAVDRFKTIFGEEPWDCVPNLDIPTSRHTLQSLVICATIAPSKDAFLAFLLAAARLSRNPGDSDLLKRPIVEKAVELAKAAGPRPLQESQSSLNTSSSDQNHQPVHESPSTPSRIHHLSESPVLGHYTSNLAQDQESSGRGNKRLNTTSSSFPPDQEQDQASSTFR